MFVTVLHQLADPKNIAMILRSHVAFGGSEIIFSGYDEPYVFSKKYKGISRSLEKQCSFIHIKEESELFDWFIENNYTSVAVEISDISINLPEYDFNNKTALILGTESGGLSSEFISRCDNVVKIPQFGNIGSMNVAISASIVMYELNRGRTDIKPVIGQMYDYK